MNYETAIELAHQRMREIGKNKDEYHIEPVVIVGTVEERLKKEIILKAYNEYYYLVNYENLRSLKIMSDSGYFDADDYTENTTQEFTGLIKILLVTNPFMESFDPRPKSLDFIKVTFY